MSNQLPEPRLIQVYRLEATVDAPLQLGDIGQGRRHIVPLTGGTFTGPEINGQLLPGASADWQVVLPDGTALGDIRYTLQTGRGGTRRLRRGRSRLSPAPAGASAPDSWPVTERRDTPWSA